MSRFGKSVILMKADAMTPSQIKACFFVIVLAFWPGAAWCEPRVAGGWIDRFDGPVDAYTVQRGEQEVPVAIYLPVYIGDRIRITEGHELIIGRSDGSTLTLHHSNKAYVVDKPDSSVSMLDNFLEWAGGWFGKYTDNTHGEHIVGLISRGDEGPPISMSLFPTGHAHMLSGKRRITLYWVGGKPPFSIRIRNNNKSDPILKQEGLKEGRTTIGPLDFSVGSYYLEVNDAREVEIVRIDVLADDASPVMPSEIRNANMPKEVMNTLEAMWLAGQDDGNWVLEAYQRVSNSTGGQSASSLLRQALEQGIVPSTDH